jgi:hypothetical protein
MPFGGILLFTIRYPLLMYLGLSGKYGRLFFVVVFVVLRDAPHLVRGPAHRICKLNILCSLFPPSPVCMQSRPLPSEMLAGALMHRCCLCFFQVSMYLLFSVTNVTSVRYLLFFSRSRLMILSWSVPRNVCENVLRYGNYYGSL